MSGKYLSLFFLFIVIFSLTPIKADNLLMESEVEYFIEEIINEYNRKIFFREYPENEKEREKFNYNQQYFSLYLHDEKGFSFNISYFFSNDNRTLIFVVSPIKFNDGIEIFYDKNPDFSSYHTMVNLSYFGGELSIIRGNEDHRFEIPKFDYYIFAGNINKIMNKTDDYADYKAEWIYQEDLQYIEQQKIKEIWKPFTENYSDILYEIDYVFNTNLSDIDSEIDNKIMGIDNNNGYTYNLFLDDFSKLNTSLQHYLDLPEIIDQWNVFINYTSSIDFCIECYPKINSSYHEILYNIGSNESYHLNNFYQDKIKLNNSIQKRIKMNEENLRKWIYSILLFISISTIVFLLTHIINIKTDKEKWIEVILVLLPMGFGFIGGLIVNLILNLNIYQQILIIISIPLGCIIYYSIIIIKQMMQNNKINIPKKK